ncbi:Uncharacterized protein DAT39_000080 [Clarias magur]|uniref:Uncharacterized protein n=1 Tax=Clarias magur TaxID=1594786 RepID=A0A8J4XH79_CLAMG|nr:Uncharacterized protein DAT39_000080 [Clarias magur]
MTNFMLRKTYTEHMIVVHVIPFIENRIFSTNSCLENFISFSSMERMMGLTGPRPLSSDLEVPCRSTLQVRHQPQLHL